MESIGLESALADVFGFDGLRRAKKIVLTWYLWGTGGITDEILGPPIDGAGDGGEAR